MSNALRAHTALRNRVITHGAICGWLGATSIALWFLVVDTLAGQPLNTPLVLGGAAFGMGPTWETLMLYTLLHLGVFTLIGIAAAALIAVAAKMPSALFAVVLLFAFLEVAIHVFVGAVAVPLLGSLAWLNIAAGNFIAAFVAGTYLWRRYPAIGRSLARRPLGVPAEL